MYLDWPLWRDPDTSTNDVRILVCNFPGNGGGKILSKEILGRLISDDDVVCVSFIESPVATGLCRPDDVCHVCHTCLLWYVGVA